MSRTVREALRVVATLVLGIVALKGILALAGQVGFHPRHFEDPDTVLSPMTIAVALAILLAPMLVVLASQRYLHRRSFGPLGLRGPWLVPFGWGALAGAVVKLAAISVAVALSRNATITPVPAPAGISAWLPYYAWYLFAMLLNSVSEELTYRAYPISSLKGVGGLPMWAIIVGAAALFSLMHFLTEKPDAWRFLYRFAFGIATGLLFARQGSLAGVAGLHTGWNFVALSFSGEDWRLGSLFAVAGVGPRAEAAANVAMLAVLALSTRLLEKRNAN